MKRLLMTGASGFIGRHCMLHAFEAGFEIHSTTTQKQVYKTFSETPATWHQVDLLKVGAIERLIADVKPTHILHAAWETTHGTYWSAPSNLDWLKMGIRAFEAFGRNRGTRFISVGSCAEYKWGDKWLIEGVTTERPETYYGKTKLSHRQELMKASEKWGFSAATGLVFFGYGPYEKFERVIPYVCQALASDQAATFSSGKFFRDYMHVDDIGRGFVALLDSNLDGVCNICSGTPVRLSDIIMSIGKLSRREDLIHLGVRADRSDEPNWIVGNNSKIRSTGWEPSISLQQGLEQTYAWWQQRI